MKPAENLTVTRGCGLDSAVTQFEKWFIWWSLEKNGFNQSRSAVELKIHRNSLASRIHEWGWQDKVQAAYAGAKGSDVDPPEVGESERGVIAGHSPVSNGGTI